MDVFAVEAFAASWIEIMQMHYQKWMELVEAFAASWIEMYVFKRKISSYQSKPLRLRGLKYPRNKFLPQMVKSKPLRLRGLKFWSKPEMEIATLCRSLCGFVD